MKNLYEQNQNLLNRHELPSKQTNHRRHRPPLIPRTWLFRRIRRQHLRRGRRQPRYFFTNITAVKNALLQEIVTEQKKPRPCRI